MAKTGPRIYSPRASEIILDAFVYAPVTWIFFFLLIVVVTFVLIPLVFVVCLFAGLFFFPCSLASIRLSSIHAGDDAELAYVKCAYPERAKVSRIVLDPPPNSKTPWCVNVVSLSSSSSHHETSTNVVFFHGTGSSAALVTASVAPILSRKYNLYSVDLPGCGRSLNPPELAAASPDSMLLLYYDFFEKLFANLQLDPRNTIIVAHSISAFLLYKWCYSGSHAFKGLYLVNPAGVFPSLGSWGAYWAVLFKAGIPMSLVRFFGCPISLIIAVLTAKASPSTILRMKFWYQLQSSSSMINIPSRFIRVNYMSSYWILPMYDDLVNSKAKGLNLAFIWSKLDNIFPPAILEAVMSTHTHPDSVPRAIISGAPHSPFQHEGGEPFVEAFEKVSLALALQKNTADCVDVDKPLTLAQSPDEIELDFSPEPKLPSEVASSWASSFSTRLTQNRVEALYAALCDEDSGGC